MTEPHRTRKRVNVGPALESLMDARVGQPPMALPSTKSEFDRLAAAVESDLRDELKSALQGCDPAEFDRPLPDEFQGMCGG